MVIDTSYQLEPYATSRLLISPLLEKHKEVWVSFRQNPQIMQYVGDGSPENATQAHEHFDRLFEHQTKYSFGFWAIYKKDDLSLVGFGGLIHPELTPTNNTVELGYFILPNYWKQGYATESVESITMWGYRNLDIKTIAAKVDPKNLDSQKVLTKSGFLFSKQIVYNNCVKLLFIKNRDPEHLLGTLEK